MSSSSVGPAFVLSASLSRSWHPMPRRPIERSPTPPAVCADGDLVGQGLSRLPEERGPILHSELGGKLLAD
eukprot:5130852-Pyramimonas_sp.AAC.1